MNSADIPGFCRILSRFCPEIGFGEIRRKTKKLGIVAIPSFHQ
nr:MAG TPA: hypothetical protein [Caudoviricetes sp.]